MLKRAFDIGVTVLLLIIISPLFLLLVIAIRLFGGPGPVFFRHERATKGGVPFQILKFRTMVDQAEHLGAGIAIERNDPRITTLGRFLRKTSLDELPQLINILRGEMSLVGPRPLAARYIERYNAFQRRRLEVLPGITGWTQVTGRNDQTWEEKFEKDVHYVDHQSFLLDLKILWLTVFVVLSGKTESDDGSVKEFFGSTQE